MRQLVDWVIDYTHIGKGYLRSILHKNPPKHYLDFVIPGKSSIILIPGIASKWTFLKPIADLISLRGHPVYIIPTLGYNFLPVSKSAEMIQEVINKNNLEDVLVVGHSKGGLIGKFMLMNDPQKKIKLVITIAAPFNGSKVSQLVPLRSYQEIKPNSKLINYLNSNKTVNQKIVSIYPEFDNHIQENEGSYLKGAKNIRLKIRGHTVILNSKLTQEEILKHLP